MSTRGFSTVAILGACALWAACSKGANKADSAAGVDTSAAAATTPPPATAAPAPLTDVNIVALLDEANAGDSTAGAVAAKKGKNAAVKEFARDMMRDHHALRKAGQDAAKKENLAAAPPSNDTLATASQKWADSLNAMPAGADWDKAYIDHEVAAHQAVQALLMTAVSAAQDTVLKALIVKAQPTIDAHLKKAQDVQAKLGGNTAMAPTGDTTAGAPKSKKSNAKKK
jgi:putative membrane protein